MATAKSVPPELSLPRYSLHARAAEGRVDAPRRKNDRSEPGPATCLPKRAHKHQCHSVFLGRIARRWRPAKSSWSEMAGPGTLCGAENVTSESGCSEGFQWINRSLQVGTNGSSMKKIFLTGASSGIGRAIAEMLVVHGHEVWGTSRNLERIRKVPGLHPIRLDL